MSNKIRKLLRKFDEKDREGKKTVILTGSEAKI
jgi:hypothetical protein